jgi:hypothetical protein
MAVSAHPSREVPVPGEAVPPGGIDVDNAAMLRTVAEAMGDLRELVVFLGGVVLPHLLADALSGSVRSAKDVDCIADFDKKADLFAFEDALWENGFKKITNGAVCQWLLGRIRIDVLPADPEVLTFNNQWCGEAMRYAERIDIGDGVRVNTISAAYYLGTKINAFDRRGFGNFSKSKDIYDILLIFAGHRGIEEEIEHRTSAGFKAFLWEKLERIRKDSGDFSGIAACGFETDPALRAYLPEAVVRMRNVIAVVERTSRDRGAESGSA